jgi:hypothetical protein
MKLVVIATFTNTLDAHVLKGRLESEGIECFLKDENMIGMNPFTSNALGGIKLQVWEDEAEWAKDVITQNESFFGNSGGGTSD